MAVTDRWHKTRAAPGEPVCREHGRVPTADHGEGKQYQARWRDENGRQCSRNFTSKRDAVSFAAQIRTQLDAGTSLDLAAAKARVRDYAAAHRDRLLHRDSTAERMERAFRLHVDQLPLGGIAVGNVRSSHLQSWVKDRAHVLAPSTLAVLWSYLASMFAAAVIDRVIGVSPCAGVKLPGQARHGHYIPSPGQVHALVQALPPQYSAVGYVAAGCGLRGAEITALEAGAVDFLRREVDVSQQLVCVTGQPPYLGPPKTRTSARTCELPKVAAAALARHIELFPPGEAEIWDRTDPDPRRHHRRIARLLFTTAAGGPVHRATWSHFWGPAARAAGIPQRTGLHCLRHYFATLLIHNGASVKTVQLALGHSTPMITLNTYVGEWPEASERTRSIIDAALGDGPAMCTQADRSR